MSKDTFHLSDQDLLLALDGELPTRDSAMAARHLAACWTCRVRKQEIEATIADFVRCHHRSFEEQLPSGDGPRSLLRARLDQLGRVERRPWRDWFAPLLASWRLLVSTLLALVAAMVLLPSWSHPDVVRAVTVTMPDPRLTPGATIVMQPAEVCASDNVKNREVSASLQRKVFEKYGIRNAPPQAYEVDYLITPALGGAEDEHNLWPHSYDSTVWNAFVKDQLEDYLRSHVCSGSMDLVTAQHEIAGDWIAAYKKYFLTDKPLREIPR
jgi:hypothetical protein